MSTRLRAAALESVQANPRLVAIALIAVLCVSIVRYFTSPWRKLPPGPRGLPVIGSILQLRHKPWLTFTKWKNTYGPIMHLNIAGQPLMVINSLKVAADLLDRRAGIYSDRPRNIVASDLLTGGLLVVFTRHNDTWRKMRKAGHEGLNKGVAHKYHPIQFKEAVLLASSISTKPKEWDSHFRRAAASVILAMVYDKEPIVSETDPSVTKINDFVARLTRAAMPGAHFVEFFPWMLNIPSRLAPWKAYAEYWFKTDTAMFKSLFNSVKEKLTQGDERPSLAATLIKDASRNGLSETENVWLAATMYAAGAETTSGVLAWWMLAMVAYPETQRLAQAELDRVVGRHRIPTFADFGNLPYIRAMVKEALRWRPIDPVGLPHRSTEDDWYEGYYIPAGTIIIPNVWNINRDPELFGSDAGHFNPSRHLNEKGQLRPSPADTKEEGHVTYGFGRRICVGRHVSNNSLFIDIAMILWANNIEPEKDKDGNVIPIDVDGCVEDGLVVRPIPFGCKVTPRFPEAMGLLDHAREELNVKFD